MRVMIFWNLTTFQYRFNSPHVKRSFLSNMKNIAYNLSYELPNDSKLRILGN